MTATCWGDQPRWSCVRTVALIRADSGQELGALQEARTKKEGRRSVVPSPGWCTHCGSGSRATVDGARSRVAAIWRIECPVVCKRAISQRSSWSTEVRRHSLYLPWQPLLTRCCTSFGNLDGDRDIGIPGITRTAYQWEGGTVQKDLERRPDRRHHVRLHEMAFRLRIGAIFALLQ